MPSALAGCGGTARRAPDPVNHPTIDYDAPERQRAQPALPDSMPPIPEDGKLRSFYVSPTTTNSFEVDPASLRVIGHRIIQFTLVATSRRGVRNISYDAIDCESGQFQMLALGRDGEGWSQVSKPQWRAVRTGDTVNDPYRELARTWCDGGAAAGEPAELLRRLDAVPQRYLNR